MVVSVAVSVFSVLFSLLTWLASERRTALERINQDRTELRETLRRLSDLDRRMARIDIEFADLPAEPRGGVGAGMTTEHAMLAPSALLKSGEEDALQLLIIDAVADPLGDHRRPERVRAPAARSGRQARPADRRLRRGAVAKLTNAPRAAMIGGRPVGRR